MYLNRRVFEWSVRRLPPQSVFESLYLAVAAGGLAHRGTTLWFSFVLSLDCN